MYDYFQNDLEIITSIDQFSEAMLPIETVNEEIQGENVQIGHGTHGATKQMAYQFYLFICLGNCLLIIKILIRNSLIKTNFM